jgi:hypothetical protein
MVRQYRDAVENLRRWTAAGALLALFGSDVASAQPLAADIPGTGRIHGRILRGADGTPVEGHRVRVLHLTAGRVFESVPTDAGGRFEIGGLPHGFFDVAVEQPAGLWLADRVINLAPASRVELVLTLGAENAGGLAPDRTWPGWSGRLLGAFALREAPRGREFWRTPKGVAILVGGAAVALLAIAAGAGNETNATPVVP